MTETSAEKRHWVRLTRVCNQRCLFCLDRDAQNGTTLALDAVRRDLEAGRSEGLRRVVLSGGEPTIHPRYLEIVALARALGYEHIQTITNGRRFCYPDFLRGALDAGLDEITFSLHGHTAALHDRLTKVPGSFVQAVTALRRALGEPGLIVSVDVVINRLNLPVLRELLDFFVGLGVSEFDLLALVPFGDAWRHREELFCDFEEPESRRHLRRALELSRRADLHIWTNRLRPEHLADFEPLIQPPEKILDELRGRKQAFARRLKTGKPMTCKGPSCRYCFLRDFCADLDVVLERGELEARPAPPCAPGPGARAAAFRFGAEPDIFAFGEFFIRARYFAQGGFCASCEHRASCAGMPVGQLRRSGFAPAGGRS